MRNLLILISLVFLSACTNQNILELRLPNGVSGDTGISVSSRTERYIGSIDSKIKEEVKENKVVCSKFELPELLPLPPIPKEILNKTKLTEEQVIDVLADHILTLRNQVNQTRTDVITSYNEYLRSCQK